MTTSREDLERSAVHMDGDEPQRNYVQNMARSLLGVLALSDALPAYHQPDHLPGSEYDVGYYDGIMAAVRAIHEGMVWRA